MKKLIIEGIERVDADMRKNFIRAIFIGIDNAFYHSVKKDLVPTTTWKKDDIINWLKTKDIVIDKPMVKFLIFFFNSNSKKC